MSKKEIKFVLITALILIIITGLPYLYGYLTRGDYYYLGTHYLNGIDGSVYISNLYQVKEGAYLLDNLFTNEIPAQKVFNPFWLILGLVARIFNLAPVVIFHLARIILIPVFLLILYKVTAYFSGTVSLVYKKLVFLFAIFASGLGAYVVWLLPPGPSLFEQLKKPMDIWVSEGFNFLALSGSPHFLASLSLILLILYFFFLSTEKKKLRYGLLSGILSLALFSFHPFHVLTIYLVPFAYLIIKIIQEPKMFWLGLKNYCLLVLVSLPAVIYYLFLIFSRVEIRNKAIQNVCLTPPAFNFFVSYGFVLFLAIFAIIYLINKKAFNNQKLFIFVWFCCGFVLMYFPIAFQRRLSEGFQVPLAILAFYALAQIYFSLRQKWPRITKINLYFFLPLFILLFCASNFYEFYNSFTYLNSKSQIMFVPNKVESALKWYQSQTTTSQTLLAIPYVSNIVPGLINRRVFIGHNVETFNFSEKFKKTHDLFTTNDNDELKKEFLKSNRIDYVFDWQMDKTDYEFQPEQKDYLEKVYDQDQVTIYKVKY